ncbi:MAG TPA: hypothetical protein VII86_05015, partial [Thermoanaerobaculia bacterium]
ARELLTSQRSWRRARERGYEAARRFRPEEVAPQLREGIRWARERAAAAPDALPSLALSEDPKWT